MADLNDTQCCAIMEISDLSHSGPPERAMLDVCQNLEDYDSFYDDEIYNEVTHSYEPNPKAKLMIPGLITFSGVTKWEKGRNGGDVTYGPKFKAFIEKEKLGTVVASPLTTNRVNHPGRQIRAWMWKPNVRTLTAWYAKHKK